MKRIILTESQYKRLVRRRLNEQNFKFSDGYSIDDIKSERVWHYLAMLLDSLWYKYKKDVYIKSIEGDKVVIDLEKYDEEEKKFIKDELDRYFHISKNTEDSYDDTGNMDFSFDTEPVDDEEQEDEITYTTIELDNSFHAIPTYWLPIMTLVGEGESESYDSYYPGKIKEGLSKGTIEDAIDFVNGNSEGNSAVGRWQFTKLANSAKKIGLELSDKFSPENQDKMAIGIIKRKGITKDLIKNNPVDAALKFAQIWAALPVLEDTQGDVQKITRGQSYYEGDEVNTSNIKPEQVEQAFKQMGMDTPKDAPKIPFRNKTEGNAFRQWVIDNYSEVSGEINLDPIGDWKEGQKYFKDYMLKAWEYPVIINDKVKRLGTIYIDGNHYKELEETNPIDLDKRNFHKIPEGNNLWRSGQMSIEELDYVIKTYGIKNIIRMNKGSGDNIVEKGSEVITTQMEKDLADSLDVNFQFINAHDGYQTGKGYVVTTDKVQAILNQGNTLIHCSHGADRTGGQVGRFLKDTDKYSDQELWDYTTKYNRWCNKNKNKFDGKSSITKGGYSSYAQSFIDDIDYEMKQKLCNNDKGGTKKDTDKIKILVVGDSQSAGDSGKYHHKLNSDSYNVTNVAAESATTSKMLAELKQHNLDNYDVVIIFGGGNDGNREITDKTAQNNLDEMYNMVKDSGTTLIAISNPTKKNSPHHKTWIKTTDAIGQHTEKSSIPDYKILVNSKLSGEEYFSDGYHLNSKSQDWIYEKLKNILDKL